MCLWCVNIEINACSSALMFFILQKVRLGYCKVSLEMTGPYAAASGLFRPDSSTVSHQIMGVRANVEHVLFGLRSM